MARRRKSRKVCKFVGRGKMRRCQCRGKFARKTRCKR